jgi:hypothetical protein
MHMTAAADAVVAAALLLLLLALPQLQLLLTVDAA